MVRSTLKKILRHSVLYGLSNLFVSLTALILIPLYTVRLRPEEYGVYSIITLFGTVIFYIYDMGMVNALVRFYFDFDKGDAAGKKQIASTILWFFVVVSVVFSLFLLWNSGTLSLLLVGSKEYAYVIQLMVALVFFNTVSGVPITVLRMDEKSTLFMALFVLKSLGIIILSYIFLALLGRSLLGVFEAMLWATALFAVFAFILTFRSYVFDFSLKYIGPMLKYGLPLCPAILFGWVIDFSDRYFLRHFLTLSEVGLYSLGYKFGQITYMAVLSFLMCWGPILFSIIKEKNAPETIARLSTYIVSAFMFITLIVSSFSREIVALMAQSSYLASYKVIPLISFSYYLFGLYMLFLSGIQVSKQVFKQPIILGAASVLNISLNLILIPRLGIIGAAVATLLTYLFVVLYTYLEAQRSYAIPYELNKIALATLLGIAFFAATTFICCEKLLCLVAVKLLIVCLYPAALFLLGVIGREALKKGRATLVNVATKAS